MWHTMLALCLLAKVLLFWLKAYWDSLNPIIVEFGYYQHIVCCLISRNHVKSEEAGEVFLLFGMPISPWSLLFVLMVIGRILGGLNIKTVSSDHCE